MDVLTYYNRGHIEMLQYAKSLGDCLIVGIDSDAKVKSDKGVERPYNNEIDRKFMLKAIKFVDEVVIFDSAIKLENLIENIAPHYMVIGSDWKGKKVVGQQHCKELKFFDRISSYSTTNILENNR